MRSVLVLYSKLLNDRPTALPNDNAVPYLKTERNEGLLQIGLTFASRVQSF